MENDSASVIRTRAELARRLAGEMQSEQSRRDLLQMADDLEAKRIRSTRRRERTQSKCEQYRDVLELLDKALQTSRTFMAAEDDPKTIESLRVVVEEIEAAIAIIERERSAISLGS
jgi:hypothetical protein